MSGKQSAPSTVAGPTTRGRVFAVVSRRDPTWVTAMVLIEPGPSVYSRRDGVWALDVLLGRRIARGGVQLRELSDRSKVSTEVSRFDKSVGDAAGVSVTRARMPAPSTTAKTAKSKTPTKSTPTPLTPWQVRASERAKAAPREGRAVVGRDVLAERRRTRDAILASGGLTASAVPVAPARASSPESLRRDRAALARRRDLREARAARRRHEARSEALTASAVRRGMAVSGMVGRV